jgi:hypothetical protein
MNGKGRMSMRRVLYAALIAVLLLAACGGGAADTTVPAPPNSTAFEGGDNPKISQLVDQLKSQVPAQMKTHGIKDTPEKPIVQEVYQSTSTIQEIGDFYRTTLVGKGWVEDKKMPSIQDGVLIDGYTTGTTTLVVNAVDAKQLGGSGVVIYTVKGST